MSDFGTFVGADRTFRTPSSVGTASARRAHVKGKKVSIHLTCSGAKGATCALTVRMTVTEIFRGRKLIGVTARKKKIRRVTVTVGVARVTLSAGQTKTVKVSLNRTGKRLLRRLHRLNVTLKVTQALSGHHTPGRSPSRCSPSSRRRRSITGARH